MFKSIGVPELLLILLVIFIFFGAGKLPQVGAQFGKAIRAFKKSQTEDDADDKSVKENNVIAAKSTSPQKEAESTVKVD